MEPSSHPIQQMTLRAFDLSERTARRGRSSLDRRFNRWKARAFMIAQCSVTAALAWFLAVHVLDHSTPFFAPVAAIVCLGISFGQRLRRSIDVALGVAVGVLIGDLFVTFFGSGVWQIVVVVALAMSVATLLGAGQLMIIQAGVQSTIIVALAPNPGQALDRWLDAVVGCVCALAVATIAPSAPLRKPGLLAAKILVEIAATLDAAEKALRAQDVDAADAVLVQARAAEADLAALNEAASEGLAVVRHSPFRRGDLPAVQAYAELAVPLDRASRNVRVLARRCAVALWRNEAVPLAYLLLMSETAETVRFMGTELQNGRLPVAARERLIKIGERSSHLKLADSISAVVILAQLRSIITDMLELTGLDYGEARTLLPEMD
ncbi:MAG: hypothetical protein JWN06_1325 [Propionibacteriaceae bacterium]|jgi:uncharacterized membrane protein YgaE (UPF0421/DUF939 family)|nr:hypothetical protein [Propionibacteriaceae bacterium]